MAKLRKNIITGEWVVIAPERSKRPEDFVHVAAPKREFQKECPFCPEAEAYQKYNIKEAETKNIYVIPNKYPAFSDSDDVVVEDSGFYESTKSNGAHEVVIFKDHGKDFYDYPQEAIVDLFKTYQNRYLHFRKDPQIEYAMAIHNHGPEAGASVEHYHSQLFVSSIIPNYIGKELTGVADYFNKYGRCVFCDVIKHEQDQKIRIIYENSSFIAFTFFAARFQFEIWILPKRHQNFFENESIEVLTELADCFRIVFAKLNKSLNYPPFNFWIHSAPPNQADLAQSYHWHIEIAPRLAKFGGYEMGSGVVIDVVSPESAAKFLREKGT